MNQLHLGIALCGLIILSGPGVARADDKPATISPTAPSTAPKLITDGQARIAVVRQLNSGDYYQSWIAGLQAEAKRLHTKVDVYNADGDNAKQALFLQQAVSTKPDAIVIGWGFADSLKAGVAAAKAASIPLVVYDAEIPPGPDTVVVTQSHVMMMQDILSDFTKTMGGGQIKGKVIYVYVAGYHALDERNKVWKQFLKDNPGITVAATVGVVNSNTATQTADQVKAALSANPDTVAVIAPYDEFAKGAALGVEELGMQGKVNVYGMDMSTADIAVMTKAKSPWVATATTDAANLGAVTARAAIAKMTGELDGDTVVVPPLLITQEALRKEGIKNVEQLGTTLPGLRTPEVLRAPWMEGMK